MIIEDTRKTDIKFAPVNTAFIGAGTVFYGQLANYDDEPKLYLRSYRGLVDLGYPSRSFIFFGDNTWPDVIRYQPVLAKVVVQENL